MQPISITYPFRPFTRSLASNQVSDLFGLTHDEPPHVIAENVDLDIQASDLVLFTGPSGSGKSSLMRAAASQLNAIDIASIDLPDVPLVDALPGSVNDRLATLAACGLSEARVLLRKPCELSDGQRYRFRLAYAFAMIQPPQTALMCDEFAAILDRTLAKVLAFNLRKLVTRTGIGALCATTHDDLAEDLNPDVHVKCLGDGLVEIMHTDRNVCATKNLTGGTDIPVCDVSLKKSTSPSPTISGSAKVPEPTGRTSLGGITVRTTSPSSNGSSCFGTTATPSESASSAAPPRR